MKEGAGRENEKQPAQAAGARAATTERAGFHDSTDARKRTVQPNCRGKQQARCNHVMLLRAAPWSYYMPMVPNHLLHWNQRKTLHHDESGFKFFTRSASPDAKAQRESSVSKMEDRANATNGLQ